MYLEKSKYLIIWNEISTVLLSDTPMSTRFVLQELHVMLISCLVQYIIQLSRTHAAFNHEASYCDRNAGSNIVQTWHLIDVSVMPQNMRQES
jgi:hypothetical protein